MQTNTLTGLESLRAAFNEFAHKLKRQGGIPLRRVAELQTLVNDYITIAMEVDLGMFAFDTEEEDY